jgi:UDP-2,3-diacylglucosamine pyrophosphatase LpxH
MKNILRLSLVLLLMLTLFACKPDNEEITYQDITIEIASETITFNSIDVRVHFTQEIDHEDELYEIALFVAGHIYEKHLESMRSNRYILTIRLHDGSTLSGINTAYGHVVFMVNRSVTEPGLSLESEHFILD